MGNATAKLSCMVLNRPVPKRNSTPASRAAASGTGIRPMSRLNHPVTPLTRMSRPEKTKAPTACAIGTPLRPVVSSAAPGVDHAVTTGAR